MNFVVVHGEYKLDGPCPLCGATCWRCRPGEWAKCEACGVKMLRFGRAPAADCVSPNGRIDGHLSYVNLTKSGDLVCSFCKKPMASELQGKTGKEDGT